jgi:hypothetical protein
MHVLHYWNDLSELNRIYAELILWSTVVLPRRINAQITELIDEGFARPQTDAQSTGNNSPTSIDAPQAVCSI